jgi:four helix bundle protein
LSEKIKSYHDLRVYQNAMDAAMEVYEISRKFPIEERYSLVDQIRHSSRSVCANLAEAWRKRRNKAAFIAKISDVETETCETQVWLEFALKYGYIEKSVNKNLDERYDHIIAQLIKIIESPDKWLIKAA